MYIRKLIIVILCLLIAGCAGQKPLTKQLISKINNDISSKYKIDHGILFAKYDLLMAQKNSKLHNPDYVKIVNDASANNVFLEQFHSKFFLKKNTLSARIKGKIFNLFQLINYLQRKYNILSKSNQLHFASLKTSTTRGKVDYLELLSKLDLLANQLPVLTPEYKPKITSYYGNRRHPISGKRSFHSGIDMSGGTKANVYAANSGRVVLIAKLNGYGKVVDIQNDKISTRYAHLSKILIKEGEHVMQGQLIAHQGKTGYVTNEHLHFEIVINDKKINPYQFIFKDCSK